MGDIEPFLKAVSLVQAVAEYFGLIETMDLKLERLIHSELRAANTALEQAANSTVERTHLLREARDHFNKAIHLESDDGLAAAYYGLGMCHHMLGDFGNAKNAMLMVYNMEFIKLPIKKMIFSITTVGPLWKWTHMVAKLAPMRERAALYLGKDRRSPS